MSRSVAVMCVAIALALAAAQDPQVGGTLPPGPAGGAVEVVHAHLLQAQLFEDGRVMFLVPRGDQEPALFVKLDGKDSRAVDRDLKPLNRAELQKRLQGWTAVLAVQSEFELDPFFLKVLNERSVVVFLPKKDFAVLTEGAKWRKKPGEVQP
jgi:hypothetical protein